MTATIYPMFPLPADLQTQLLAAGWLRLHDSLFACNVDLGASQPERGVWLTLRSSDSVEVVRPIAIDEQGPRPALHRERATHVDDIYSVNGTLILVRSLRFPPDIRDLNSTALVLAGRTPQAPRELNLTVDSGWSPFAGDESWELRRWWIDDGRSDW